MVTPLDSVPFEIGGRQLHLRYSLGALAEAQRVMGVSDFRAVLEAIDNIVGAAVRLEATPSADLRVVNPVVWAGLLESWEAAEGKRPEPAEVASLLTLKDIRRVLVAIARAFSLSVTGPLPPEVEVPEESKGGAGEEANPPPPPGSPGPASSPPAPSSGSGSGSPTPTP